MKITLFTSNQSRHNYLVNSLEKVCNELFVIQEKKTGSKSSVTSHKAQSKVKNIYFNKVVKAEKKVFGDYKLNKKIKILKIKGNINDYSLKNFKDYLKSDLFIVYGSTYIKGKLLNILKSKKAIGLHMGISPYYRGTDCNFWATYDGRLELVGATIYLLSDGLDDGNILFHTFPKKSKNYFIFSMLAVKSAFECLVKNIENNRLLKIKPIKQNKKNEIRYTKMSDFTDKILGKFKNKKINLKIKKRKLNQFVNPFDANE
tara:strand:- start:1224 stop:2000 length:777 start_codon:yes stop_codon:yes gene_type:complete